jgi:hypothetical protein
MSIAASIRFPFWVLAPSISDSHAGTAGHIPAFTDSATLAAYLKSQHGRDRHIRLITRDSLVLFLADLHLIRSPGLRFDPRPDGSGGTQISIAELMTAT